jgi:sugar phosphate isomerase/epimerase
MNPTYDRIHLGVSQLVWGYDLSRADRFIQCLDEASAIGYEGVLLFDSTLPFWYNRPRELRSLLDERKLAVAAVIHRPSLDFKGTTQLAKFVAEIGGDRLVLSGRDGSQAEWHISLPLLERHGEIANAHGLRAVYHHHTGWIAETMEQYERLLVDTSRAKLGAMLDCGHATLDFVGHSALEFFNRHHDIIEYVEFKDWSPSTGLNTEVGQGTCDFRGIARAMKVNGWKGWVVVEQNGTARTPKDSSQQSYRYIREELGVQ